MRLNDILYGSVVVPTELTPFLKIPEFVRLRGVRLSNVDSIEFKDLNGPSRWEHSIGVLHLADICARQRGMERVDYYHLCLAALLHDVATPPFAHTAEYVLRDFDHELETYRLLSSRQSEDVFPDAAVYLSETAQFRNQCRVLSRETGVHIDPDAVAAMIIGQGEFGFLISGTLDLDNADNVTRASHYMGFRVDPSLPVRLAAYLATVDQAPMDIGQMDNADIQTWATYRANMYRAFYNSTIEERGREAFLQHLFRRAVLGGVPRRALVWNTDEGLLSSLSQPRQDGGDRISLPELVRRYRLLQTPTQVATVDIATTESLRVLRLAAATAWIEERLTTDYFEAIVAISVRKFNAEDGPEPSLLPSSAGQLHVYKIGGSLSQPMLPEWLQVRVPKHARGRKLAVAISKALSDEVNVWTRTRPWSAPSERKSEMVRERLESAGDWSFRESKNTSVHTYPSTFVQAIPATFIQGLDVSGEVIVDPFGGTGNTAIEAVKAAGFGVSGDSNSIATLIAKVRTTYLDKELRDYIRSVDRDAISAAKPAEPPSVANLYRWHHPKTVEELASIKSFVMSVSNVDLRDFLLLTFSAILPSATARRGQQHGFFADNTPLAKGEFHPPYVNAWELYLSRIHRNLRVLEGVYGVMERDGGSARSDLERCSVVQVDVRSAVPADYGVEQNSVAAIVTSPPYLCMTDYTLGHRLSYHWLGIQSMDQDLALEIGSRRSRHSRTPEESIAAYELSMRSFANVSRELLRPGGYLALVLGSSQAKAFENVDILGRLDSILAEFGFAEVWRSWRNISWSRNHGYARLRQERLSVHQRST